MAYNGSAVVRDDHDLHAIAKREAFRAEGLGEGREGETDQKEYKKKAIYHGIDIRQFKDLRHVVLLEFMRFMAF
jgi:hypothetical protein